MAQDYLSEVPEERVAAWFARLADYTARSGKINGSDPLSATFMRVWLKNRDPDFTYVFDAPAHLRNAKQVQTQLAFQRDVFLTKQKARYKDVQNWAGVLPRVQGLPGYQKWDVAKRPLELQYQSLAIASHHWFESGGHRTNRVLRKQRRERPFHFAARIPVREFGGP
jgi:hypothetical protein